MASLLRVGYTLRAGWVAGKKSSLGACLPCLHAFRVMRVHIRSLPA